MVDVSKIDEFFNGRRPFSDINGSKLNAKVKFLRMAKLIMPSIAAVIIGFIMVFPNLKKETVVATADITLPKAGELEKIHIEKTVFSITDEENQITTITADKIDEVEPGSKVVKILNPKGTLPAEKKGAVINFSAYVGYYNQNEANIKVEENVKATHSDGSTIITQSAMYEFNKAFGYSKNKLHAYGVWGKLWSEGFEYYQKKELLVLIGNSKVIHEDNLLTADKEIKFFKLESRVEATENVVVSTKEHVLQADSMNADLVYDNGLSLKNIEANGNVKVINKTNVLHANKIKAEFIPGKDMKIKKIEAFENVRLVTDEGVAKGDYAIYNPQKYEIELLNNVSIEKNGNVIYGQKAITNLKTSISKIVASSKAKQRVSGVIKGSAIKEKINEKK